MSPQGAPGALGAAGKGDDSQGPFGGGNVTRSKQDRAPSCSQFPNIKEMALIACLIPNCSGPEKRQDLRETVLSISAGV